MADYFTPAVGNLGGDAIGLVKVPMRFSAFLVDETTGLQIAKQTGATVEFNQLNVSSAPRLLFWHCVTAGIPTALPAVDGVSLYMAGADGIAATSWKRTEQMRREMFYLQKNFEFTELDLDLLDFSRPIHYNGLNYLIAHISGEFPVSKEFSCLLIKI